VELRRKNVTILGAGMVGSAMAADLCHDYEVTSVDIDAARLADLAARCPVAVMPADLADAGAVREGVRSADLVIGAVPGFMGYATLQAVIEAGKDVVDISFFNEDPFDLAGLAEHHGVTAVVDCGVAPGLSNMILGYHAGRMAVDAFRCLVGGLPLRRTWPYQYKAPFSPIDVLEEYTRPARYRQNGAPVTQPALSDPEYVEIEPVGTLEAFNTDGLRTLLRTMNVPNMIEKTLRYPGHIEIMRVLRESGFLGREAINVRGTLVRPIDLTSALLFAQWHLQTGEPEYTAMQIAVRGTDGGETREYSYTLFDRMDDRTGTSSMARTTGYTCTAVARLVLEGRFGRAGIIAPEMVAAEGDCFDRVLGYLRERGIKIECTPRTVA
jgi:lysine 6-dehydrogenase